MRAAEMALAAGADGITAHLREDRRHISDADIARLARAAGRSTSNGGDRGDAGHRAAHQPHAGCLVPERREERTTEGGLDVGAARTICARRRELKAAGIRVRSSSSPSRPSRRRAPARKWWSCTPAPIASARWRTMPRAEARAGPPQARRHAAPRPAWRCMPATASTTRRWPIPPSPDRRTQHRPLPDRRGDLRWPAPGHPAHARADGRGAGRRGRGQQGMRTRDPRPRQRHHRHPPHREHLGPVRDRFLERVFTARSTPNPTQGPPAASYAKRFAAKEACAKALGTGLRRAYSGATWGWSTCAPAADNALTGGAAHRLGRLTPQGLEARIDVSLTDDFPLAQAIVIISAVPACNACRRCDLDGDHLAFNCGGSP